MSKPVHFNLARVQFSTLACNTDERFEGKTPEDFNWKGYHSLLRTDEKSEVTCKNCLRVIRANYL